MGAGAEKAGAGAGSAAGRTAAGGWLDAGADTDTGAGLGVAGVAGTESAIQLVSLGLRHLGAREAGVVLVLHQENPIARKCLPGLEESEPERPGAHVKPARLRLREAIRADPEAVVERACLLKNLPHFGAADRIGKNALPKALNLAMMEGCLGEPPLVLNRISGAPR